jgi:hypothetical protein
MLYIVLLIAAGIGLWIYSNIEENKKQQAQRDLEYARAAQARKRLTMPKPGRY